MHIVRPVSLELVNALNFTSEYYKVEVKQPPSGKQTLPYSQL